MLHSIELENFSKETPTKTIAPKRIVETKWKFKKILTWIATIYKEVEVRRDKIDDFWLKIAYTPHNFCDALRQRCFEKQSTNQHAKNYQKNKREKQQKNTETRGFLEMWSKQKWTKCNEYTFCQYNNIGLQVQTFISACMYRNHCTFEHKRQGRQNEQTVG